MQSAWIVRWILAVGLLLVSAGRPAFGQTQDRAAWMQRARWGVMTHYLADWMARDHDGGRAMTTERWNELVDRFDVERLADQLKSAGAGYQIFTIGQNSGFYASPNAAYDRLVGIQPSKCARRDLVHDLSQALHKRGMRLIVYLPSGAPAADREAVRALNWHNGADRNREFQEKWEAVVRAWSEQWRKDVDGWWFDGCYWPNTMYRAADPPNFASFAAAARAGNPESAVAFNPGVVDRILSVTPFEDYTAGEINQLDRLMIRRNAGGKVDGAQIHVLSYLGATWGKGMPRFADEELIASSRKIAKAGGAITWDVPIQPDGTISEPFRTQLRHLGESLRAGD